MKKKIIFTKNEKKNLRNSLDTIETQEPEPH